MENMKTVKEVFGVEKPIIGMLHLSGYGRDKVLENARREIDIMYRNGVNAVLVENYFGDRVDVENALKLLQKDYPDKVYGVNMLGFPEMAFDLARKYGAKFVQMDSVCGHLEPNYEKPFLKKLETLRGDGDIFLLGGVRFKYQPVRSGRSLEEDLKLGMERCDAIVVTGEGTGITTDLEKIKTFRTVLGDFPLIVGAGITEGNVVEQLALADGGIVGSWFKEYGRAEYPVDEQRVDAFMTTVALSGPSAQIDGFVYEKVDSGKENSAKLFGEFIGTNRHYHQYDYHYPAGAVITKYTGNESHVVIPSHIDGIRVVGIGEGAFYQNKTIESILFEEGVGRIGEYAFAECDCLRTVRFPVSLRMIDANAFADSPLETVKFPPNLKKIGQGAFENTNISELILPDSLQVLGDMAFFRCEMLEYIKIPAGISHFVDYEGDSWPDDKEKYFYGDDFYSYLGLRGTFEGCSSLRDVECRNPQLKARQLELMFSRTPWWIAQHKK